ncbi:hypothetical protein HOD38_02990 [archaeon]|jgi:intein/homing endonuclease|nr:hypothetical protein [archaeon]MBT4397207.1 hypothetical protein [archaeon]MBT4440587.1 hypothetical protein [archaeon]
MIFLKTRYGNIPKNQLIVEEIPDKPQISLPSEVILLYDPNIDEKSAPIILKIKNGKLRRLSSKITTSIDQIEWIRAGSSIHKIKIPTSLDPRLAYLVGYLYGDGGFKDIKNSYKKHKRFEHKIIVGDEFKIQIERIKKLFFSLFNLQTKIRDERIKKGELMYYLNPTCKIVYRFLVKNFEFKEGPKGNITMPKIIKNSSSEIKQWFLRGFVDADGDTRATEYYSSRKLPSPRIKVRLADKNFINELKINLNQEFNLNLTGPYSDNERNWYIQCGKGGMINAHKKMLFTHPIKKWRLKEFLFKKGNI